MGRNDLSKKQAMMEARRAKVASYKVRGYSLREIVEALDKDGLRNPRNGQPWSLKAVHDDVQELEARWRQNALADISQVKAAELAKLDEMEREAWAGWHRSYGKKQTTMTERSTGGKSPGDKARVDTEEMAGDPRFMAIVLDCQQRRAKMLGMDAPTLVAPTTPEGKALPQVPLDTLPTDLLRQLLGHMKANAPAEG